MNYASLNLPLPRSAQSDKWAPHAAVALALMGATDAASAVNLSALTDRMSVLAGEPVARASSTRGAWVMDKAGHLLATRKGWYALSESGVECARRIMDCDVPVAAPAPVTVEVAPAPEVEVAKVAVAVVEEEAPEVEVAPAPVAAPVSTKEAGVSWLPPVTVGAVDAYYDEDEYLLALAVEQTPCFGTYSARAEACGGCPVRGACMGMLATRMAQVAATLAKQDADRVVREAQQAEARKAEEARKADESRKAAERAAVEGILGTPAPSTVGTSNPTFGTTFGTVTTGKTTPVPAPAPTPAPEAATTVKFTEITAAFPGVCSACRLKIDKGNLVRYVSGKGMYHPGCIG
jgi:hypothetical protein